MQYQQYAVSVGRLYSISRLTVQHKLVDYAVSCISGWTMQYQ